jgi:hypothetical protein
MQVIKGGAGVLEIEPSGVPFGAWSPKNEEGGRSRPPMTVD